MTPRPNWRIRRHILLLALFEIACGLVALWTGHWLLAAIFAGLLGYGLALELFAAGREGDDR